MSWIQHFYLVDPIVETIKDDDGMHQFAMLRTYLEKAQRIGGAGNDFLQVARDFGKGTAKLRGFMEHAYFGIHANSINGPEVYDDIRSISMIKREEIRPIIDGILSVRTKKEVGQAAMVEFLEMVEKEEKTLLSFLSYEEYKYHDLEAMFE